eukprot:363140-Chlamydomonas_euryale.AAC.4
MAALKASSKASEQAAVSCPTTEVLRRTKRPNQTDLKNKLKSQTALHNQLHPPPPHTQHDRLTCITAGRMWSSSTACLSSRLRSRALKDRPPAPLGRSSPSRYTGCMPQRHDAP